MNLTIKKVLINVITLTRIILIPVLFVLNGIYAFLFLNILFITDFIDGYLARKWGVTSTSGAVLDLLGDKTLTIFLLGTYTYREMLPLWLSLLLIIRELYSMIMRFYYLKAGKELISASIVGKTKTFLLFIAFDMMILDIPGYFIMFLIVLVISYYSLFTYIKEGIKRK